MEFLANALIWVEIAVGLGILIFIHEAGHFLMAKRHGVRVEAFSLGMGPILWRRKWGETEYRLSAIPLGGYVKMAGESIGDPRTGAEYELTSKPAGSRLQIFAAGAIMNLIIAFPIIIAAYFAGMYVLPPIVTSPGMMESQAGMRPGDRVVAIDGKAVNSLDTYKKEIVRRPRGSEVPVTVRRGDREVGLTVKVGASERHGFGTPYATLGRIAAGSPAAAAGLRTGDEVLEINGRPAFLIKEIQDEFEKSGGTSFRLKVRGRGETGIREVSLQMPSRKMLAIPEDPHLMLPEIGVVIPGTPAQEADLQPGDAIVKVGGEEIASWQDLKNALQGRGGQSVDIEYKRGDRVEKATVQAAFSIEGTGAIGVGPAKTRKIAEVPEGSYFHRAGLRAGDVLEAIDKGDGVPVVGDIGTTDLTGGRWAEAGKFRKGAMTVLRDGQRVTLELSGEERVVADLEAAGFETQTFNGRVVLGLAPNLVWRTWTPGEAVTEGLKEPVDIFVLTFQLLGKLFRGHEALGNVSGPVGIISVAYDKASMSFGNFLWLLMLITVNLGVFNLLPVPLLDGGHIALLLIEKVRGRPLTPGFVEKVQLVGVVLLLGLIIFVTMNDFGKLFR